MKERIVIGLLLLVVGALGVGAYMMWLRRIDANYRGLMVTFYPGG
jgi:drug/metabolite transporter (DMT)-like permease